MDGLNYQFCFFENAAENSAVRSSVVGMIGDVRGGKRLRYSRKKKRDGREHKFTATIAQIEPLHRGKPRHSDIAN